MQEIVRDKERRKSERENKLKGGWTPSEEYEGPFILAL